MKKTSIILEETEIANKIYEWRVKEKTNLIEPYIGTKLKATEVADLITNVETVKIIKKKK